MGSTEFAANPEPQAQLSDLVVVERVLAGEIGLFEILMRRYNQRLFRVARAIVGDEAEAEDIMQDAYVRAYGALRQFEGRAAFSTWLTRIAVYEAQARRRKRHRLVPLEPRADDRRSGAPELTAKTPAPDQAVRTRELGEALAAALDSLPESHRVVFVLRVLEGLTTEETSQCLGLSLENVRVRMHRARGLLQREICGRLGEEPEQIFAFHLSRCDRVVAAVLRRIAGQGPPAF